MRVLSGGGLASEPVKAEALSAPLARSGCSQLLQSFSATRRAIRLHSPGKNLAAQNLNFGVHFDETHHRRMNDPEFDLKFRAFVQPSGNFLRHSGAIFRDEEPEEIVEPAGEPSWLNTEKRIHLSLSMHRPFH
jgi:hypothetical protein